MSTISHHIPDELLAAYAAGNLSHPYSLVVASHASMCDECRASLEAHQIVGGVILEASESDAVSNGLKTTLMDRLDEPVSPTKTFVRTGAYPGPIMAALKGKQPKWKSVGRGVKQDILSADREGSVRLLYIPAGQAMPDHGHNGLELTMVLQGSFSDESGQFLTGDVEVADQDVLHTPIADPGDACICLAATDAPLRFQSIIPRLLQPFFDI